MNGWLALVLLGASALEEAPVGGVSDRRAGREVVGLEVMPAEVRLDSALDRQSLVVQATLSDGVTLDVTDEAEFALEGDCVTLESGRLSPLADGSAALGVQYGGLRREARVEVKGAERRPTVSFQKDIMPVFMRAGCNTGGCHGSARGQDGFRLSLFGFDPDGDYHRITREMGTRRINLALPAESLLVEKAVGAVAHTGGRLFDRDSVYCRSLVDWLAKGAPKDGADVAQPVSLELFPRRAVLEGEGSTQRLSVRARYSDGSDRDVTALTVFLSNNEGTAAVDPSGLVTAGRRGEAFVMARFHTFNVGSQFLVIPAGLHAEAPSIESLADIDRMVLDKLHRMRIRPSERCSDEVFLRRVFLDVVGMLPTRAEYDSFMADPSPDKRAALVDQLLQRKEFVEMWVMKWAELLQIRTDANQGMSYKATLLYYKWLEDKISSNVPFDRIVRELLSATGGTFDSPATNYYQVERDTLKLAENAAQVFLGMRLQCAQCHNHPFDRWTMDDYYGFAAFFRQVGRKRAEDPRETIVYNRGRDEVNHPVTNQPVAPKFLGGEAPDTRNKDRRQVLADWLASAQNEWFARNLANIVWAHFFGVGIVEPVDDVRVSNPASNPELLQSLADKLVAENYDFRSLIRDICNSRTYQLATERNDTNLQDERNFSHGTVRRVRAEVLLDVLSQVTETENKFRGLPQGARAVQIADGNVSNYFLTTFGRATRTTVCSCEVAMEPSLSQALHLLNGDNTQRRIQQGGVVARLMEEGGDDAAIVEELYLRCLTRRPTEAERERLLAEIPAEPAAARQAALEDVFWALLNSKELIFNH